MTLILNDPCFKDNKIFNLNIGSGKPRGLYKEDHWLNIDVHDIPGTYKMDILDAPNHWANHFHSIHAIHVLEHVNRNYREDFIKQCARILEPEYGVLILEVPDFEKNVERLYFAMQNGDQELEHRMTTGMFGKQRYPGDQHCWGFTSRTLNELLRKYFDSVIIHRSGPEMRGPDLRMYSDHFKQENVLLAVASKKR